MPLIFYLVLLCFTDHPLDFFSREPTVVICRGLILGKDVQDTISVDVKTNIDMRNTSRCGCDTIQQVVVTCPCPLTHIHFDSHLSLVIAYDMEHMFTLCGNGGVSWNQSMHQIAMNLSAKRKRSNIQKHKILHLHVALATKNYSLNSNTISNSLIRVDVPATALVRTFGIIEDPPTITTLWTVLFDWQRRSHAHQGIFELATSDDQKKCVESDFTALQIFGGKRTQLIK